MTRLLLIGCGGFVGAILRYSISGYVQQLSDSIDFPYGTLAVNVTGCLTIGLLSQLAENRGLFSVETRCFVFIGLLGALTTFSTFGNETLALVKSGESLLALGNVAANVMLCLIAVAAGNLMANLI